MFHLRQSLRDRYFSEISPGLILMKTHSDVGRLLHAYRWKDRQNLMGDPQGKMRLQVLLLACSKYSRVCCALRRWMKISHNHPFSKRKDVWHFRQHNFYASFKFAQIQPIYRRMTISLNNKWRRYSSKCSCVQDDFKIYLQLFFIIHFPCMCFTFTNDQNQLVVKYSILFAVRSTNKKKYCAASWFLSFVNIFVTSMRSTIINKCTQVFSD